MGSVQTRLPDTFVRVDVSLIELGDSLTAVCAAIELRPDAAQSLHRAMRKPAFPRIKRIRAGGHRVHFRQEMSSLFVAEAHAQLRNDARRWLSDRVPGVFAKEADGMLPVLDLLVANRTRNPADSMKNTEVWRALGIASEFYITESAELGGLRFNEYVHPVTRQHMDRDIFSLFGEFPSVYTDEGQSLVGRSSSSRSLRRGTAHKVSIFLSRLAISSILELKSSQSADARDAAHKLHRGRSVNSLKSLRESFLRGSLDRIAIASAIKRITAKKEAFHRQAIEFETRRNLDSDKDKSTRNLLDGLAKQQSAESDELLVQDSQTREVLGVVASFSAGIEGIRSQRWSLAIAVFSLLVAAGAVFLTFHLRAQSTLEPAGSGILGVLGL